MSTVQSATDPAYPPLYPGRVGGGRDPTGRCFAKFALIVAACEFLITSITHASAGVKTLLLQSSFWPVPWSVPAY